VWAVQKAAGLQRDGVVGKKTHRALDDGVRPTARTHHGHVIEVDLAKQLVLLVDGGHVTSILNASSGSGKPFTSKNGHHYVAHTPTGTYRMGRQYDGMYTSNLGLGTMWRPKFFNGGIALHGLGFDVPPYPASHGCVRISNPAMDWVWSTGKAPQGTVVTVYR
jgi:lipoprotein-anchoring transpeptidase ErfK/SrfK